MNSYQKKKKYDTIWLHLSNWGIQIFEYLIVLLKVFQFFFKYAVVD